MKLSAQEQTLQKEFTQWQKDNCFYDGNILDMITQYINDHKNSINQFQIKNSTRKLIQNLRGTSQSLSKRGQKGDTQHLIQLNALTEYIQRALDLRSYKLLIILLTQYAKKAEQIYNEKYNGIIPGKLQNQSKLLENTVKTINISQSETLETPSIYDVINGTKSVIPIIPSPINESGVQESIFQHLLFITLKPDQLEQLFSSKSVIETIKKQDYDSFKKYYDNHEIHNQILKIIEQMVSQNDQTLFQFIETNISQLEKTYELFKQKKDNPINQYVRLVQFYVNSNKKLFKQTIFDYLYDYNQIKEEKSQIQSHGLQESEPKLNNPTDPQDMQLQDLQQDQEQPENNNDQQEPHNLQLSVQVEENDKQQEEDAFYISKNYDVIQNYKKMAHYIRLSKNKNYNQIVLKLVKLNRQYNYQKHNKLKQLKAQIHECRLDNYKNACQIKAQFYDLIKQSKDLQNTSLILVNKMLCKQLRDDVVMQQTQ